jgi:hypothetical protein
MEQEGVSVGGGRAVRMGTVGARKPWLWRKNGGFVHSLAGASGKRKSNRPRRCYWPENAKSVGKGKEESPL